MSSESFTLLETSVARRRTLGVVLIALVIGFVAVTVLQYNKAFTTYTSIYLVTDSAGNALPERADVKARGVIMGTVGSTQAHGDKVVLRLDLDPELAREVPPETTARLLPKTLFGERYVALQVPKGSSGHVSEGDTIYQDESGNAVEIGHMLDTVLPILQAVPPQDLSVTLTAINHMLEGQGDAIGRGIEQLDEITDRVVDRLPDVKADIRGIADFARTYSTAAPDLVDALDNLRTTSKTVVDMQDRIHDLLLAGADTARAASDLIDRTRGDFVAVSAQSVRPLEVFADASPAFGCTLEEMDKLHDRAKGVVGAGTENPGIRVTLELVNPRGRYLPNQDEPRWFDSRTPRCYPVVPGQNFPAPIDGPLDDGSYQPPVINTGGAPTLYPPDPMYAAEPASQYRGSQSEQDALAQVYAAASGADAASIPGWTTVIGAPSLRGNEVAFK
ncbi:MCE family protein [Tomitella fengzijianii]|uniref:MCE family protein n=2 Tax=Tomitella fengzijianii TaxID=2597660 RepID=UPI001F30FC81|nr:MCE family protein [Tomitella fengzijianii]